MEIKKPRETMNFGRLSIVLSTHAAQFEAVAFIGNFEANLAKIAAWGYEGVELAIRNPDLVDADKLETLIANRGIKVPAIGTGQAWGEDRLSFTSPDLAIRKAAIARIKSHIELARRFDAIIIIGLIRGVTPAGRTKDQSIHLLIECLQDCSEAASTQNVRMALEPLNRYETDLIHTVQDGLDLIHQIGSPNLGLLLDTFHMNIEESNIGASILLASQQIFHFHVADSNRWYPGGGHLDFNGILHALRSTGYQGWISGEFMPVPNADTAAERCISFLKKIYP
jgi:5-keto-L-gluconate epimerase